MRFIKIIFYIVLPVILLLLIFSFIFFRVKLTAKNQGIANPIIIDIGANKSRSEVGIELFDQKIVLNSNYFYWGSIILSKKIKPGFYEIPAYASTYDVLNIIDSGKVKTLKVTIPEGWRTEQIANKLAENKILSYDEFMTAAKGDEGKLFPDTYFMNPKMTAAEVIKMMIDDYQNRTAGLNLTSGDLALASIVEREAANDTDRALIAGIYQNRIDAGMKLQSDPTVEYARDSINLANLTASEALDYTFWKPAKTAEFTSVKSAFNTYQSVGLPPGPICNPGIKSIEAALAPLKTNYYYFLYGSHDGLIHPSATSAGHQAAIVQYLN